MSNTISTVERKATAFGGSAHIILPKDFVGKHVLAKIIYSNTELEENMTETDKLKSLIKDIKQLLREKELDKNN